MKKKLYFEPTKDTTIEEYITIKNGKIRDVHILQLIKEVHKKLTVNDPTLNKNLYLPLKNFHIDLKIKRIDKYISKQNNLIYTHEIILPLQSLLKMILSDRKIFVKFNFIELLIIDYSSFSWSNASTANKLIIVTIILSITAIVIGVLSLINY